MWFAFDDDEGIDAFEDRAICGIRLRPALPEHQRRIRCRLVVTLQHQHLESFVGMGKFRHPAIQPDQQGVGAILPAEVLKDVRDRTRLLVERLDGDVAVGVKHDFDPLRRPPHRSVEMPQRRLDDIDHAAPEFIADTVGLLNFGGQHALSNFLIVSDFGGNRE